MNGDRLRLSIFLLAQIAVIPLTAGVTCRLVGDSLLVSGGTTYRYTVDTPEGEGLTSTLPAVSEILMSLPAVER